MVNLSCLKPLDWELVVACARETGAVVTAEEHMVTGGLGSAVSEVLGEHCPAPLKRVGLRDTFGMSGKPDALLKHYGLTAEDIIQRGLEGHRPEGRPFGLPGRESSVPVSGREVNFFPWSNPKMRTPGHGWLQ